MQQSGYNDMQLFQQKMMLKQLQELQRKQQLHQLGDVRQQNSFNEHSNIANQLGSQFSPFFNGTPVHGAQQMLQHFQRGASPAQGMSNKVMFPYDQGQVLNSMGLHPSQLDESLYGTPVSSSRCSMGQYPHLQAMSHDSVNLMPESSGLAQKSMMQVSDFGNAYLEGELSTVPYDLVSLSQQALTAKLGSDVKSNVGHIPIQDLNSGVLLGNHHEGNVRHLNFPMKEFSERQKQSGGSATQQIKKQLGSCHNLIPLDPVEARILYDMDGNIWDAFGGRLDTGGGGFENALGQLDSSNVFPSIQNGSWSALMQSAVTETSSTDTGLQEEWSGLTFQSTDHSTDNQMSNFIDCNNQHVSWVDNNLQSASSFSSKYLPAGNDSNSTSTFQTLQQPDTLREELCQTGIQEIFRNMLDHHVAKGFSNSENISRSSSAVGFLPDFQGNAIASEEVAARGDHGSNSSTFCGSVLPDGCNVTVQTSEHMLELMHEVDQSRGDSMMKDFGSTDSDLLCEVPSASVAHPYTEPSLHAKLSRSPSQSVHNGNNIFNSQGFPHTQSGIHLTPEKTETGERSQTLPSLPCSYPLLQPSLELSQKPQWDDKATMKPTDFSSSLNVQGNYAASSTLNAPHRSNQLEMHTTSNVLAASQPLQATVSGGNRYLPSNQNSSRDPSNQIHINSSGQQFPVLDALSMPQSSFMPGISQEGGISPRVMNVWRNVSNSRQPFTGDTSKQRSVSKILDISHPSDVPQQQKQDSDATALLWDPLATHSQQEDLHRVRHGNNIGQASERNFELTDHSQNQYQNFSQFHQVRTVHNGADPVSNTQQFTALARQLSSSGYVHPKNSGIGSSSHSVPSDVSKMLGVSGDAEGDPSSKFPLQSSRQFNPSLITGCHSDSQTPSSGGDVPSSHSNRGLIHPHTAPSWFKQFGTSMYNTNVEKTGASTSTFQKSYQNLHNHTSEVKLCDTGAVDGVVVLPNTAAAFIAKQKIPMPSVSPDDIANQASIVKSKKRKITELLPWHREVTQKSMSLENTSMAEEDWASAVNRLVEMVEDGTEISKDMQPLHRARRRIVKTRQLMQQLFRSASASILSRDSTTSYDTLSYFVTRLSMGDACGLSYQYRNNRFTTLHENDLNVEKQEKSEQTMEVIEKFNDRAKKLESGFQRLEKTASFVDIGVELLELERFSVINRFAKFHIRSQPDATLKPHPQRFIAAFPITGNLPEGVQCLSL